MKNIVIVNCFNPTLNNPVHVLWEFDTGSVEEGDTIVIKRDGQAVWDGTPEPIGGTKGTLYTTSWGYSCYNCNVGLSIYYIRRGRNIGYTPSPNNEC